MITAACALGAAAGLLASGACAKKVETASASPVPTVAVAKVTTGDIAQVLKVAAEFRPFQEIDVHAKVAGYVQWIGVDVGDRVKEGQLLAILEIPELEDQVQQDDAEVKHAEEEVNRAQADLERAQSAHEVAHLAASRLSGVIKARPNLVAQQDVDDATGRDRESEAQVATAKAALAAAAQALDMAKAGRRKTGTLLAYARITAPFAGVVTHRYADTGAMIQAGTSSQTQAMPIVRLSENTLLRLVIPVPESAVSRIHIGGPVDLDVQALHKTFTGTVARFADRLDTDTRTMRVEVDVHNPDLEIVPGMYAEASIVLDQAKHVLVAPVEAIDHSSSTATILVVKPDHRLESREVTIGLESGDRAELRTGVADGDLLVVGSRAQLKAGEAVTPKAIAADAAAGDSQ